MAIFVFETYIINSDKTKQFDMFFKLYLAWYKHVRSTLYKEVKSHKTFTQTSPNQEFVKYLEISKYDNQTDYQTCMKRLQHSQEFQTEVFADFKKHFEDLTCTKEIWNSSF